MNVASTAAFQPGPYQAVYCATKAYVLSFTEALAEEVRGSGVRVSCLAPGATGTGFAAQAGTLGTRLFPRGEPELGSRRQAITLASPTRHACSPRPPRPAGRCGTWRPASPQTEAPPRAPPARPRHVLGEDRFTQAWDQGQGLTFDDAVAYATRKGGGRKRPATGWASLTPPKLAAQDQTVRGSDKLTCAPCRARRRIRPQSGVLRRRPDR